MTDVTIHTENEPPAQPDPTSAPEAVETASEAVEAVAEAEVEVAEIEAARDIEIAQIHADTDRAAIDATHDERIIALEAELVACRTRIQELEALSTVQAEVTEQATELLTQQDTHLEQSTEMNPPAEEGSEVTPVSPEDHEEPPPEPVRKKPRLRWI